VKVEFNDAQTGVRVTYNDKEQFATLLMEKVMQEREANNK
jgi:hypothetical protein